MVDEDQERRCGLRAEGHEGMSETGSSVVIEENGFHCRASG